MCYVISGITALLFAISAQAVEPWPGAVDDGTYH